jgi:hypothetical protein
VESCLDLVEDVLSKARCDQDASLHSKHNHRSIGVGSIVTDEFASPRQRTLVSLFHTLWLTSFKVIDAQETYTTVAFAMRMTSAGSHSLKGSLHCRLLYRQTRIQFLVLETRVFIYNTEHRVFFFSGPRFTMCRSGKSKTA